MKKLIPLIITMGTVFAQDDIELKSAGVDASTGIVFKNSNDVVLMDIDGDGLISISGNLTVKGLFTLGSSSFPTSDGTSGQVLTTNGSGVLSWTTLSSGSGGEYSIIEYDNIAIGNSALNVNTEGRFNVAVGTQALSLNTSNGNSAFGFRSLRYNTTGDKNVAIGNDVLSANTTAGSNTAVGSVSMQNNTTGESNSAFGANSLEKNTTGKENTAIGQGALSRNTTGNDNVALGKSAGSTITTGVDNVIIGENADVSGAAASNQIVIGSSAVGAGDNTVQLGSTSITNVKTSGTITAGAVTYPKTDGSANQVLKTDGSGALGWASVSSTPTGAITMFAAATPPSGWLTCDGSAVSRSTYSDLFSTIGTTYGAGDGSSTFNLPDFGGRGPIGYKSNNAKFDALNETGGAETHTLTVDEIPGHTHTYDKLDGGAHSDAGSGATTDYSSSNSRTSGSTGGGQAHNILDPYLTINFIIKQ